MMSRHKRNGSKQHHHIIHENVNSFKNQRHDVLSFRNGDMSLHNMHDRFSSQRHRRDLSKCLGAHKQKRRLSIGCSRDDIVEVHPQCSEAGDEGKGKLICTLALAGNMENFRERINFLLYLKDSKSFLPSFHIS